MECRYYSALPASNAYAIPRPDGTTATKLAAVVGQAYQAQPGSSEDKALYQVSKPFHSHLAKAPDANVHLSL